MKQLGKILVLNLLAGSVAGLLVVTLYPWDRSGILFQFVRALGIAFCVGTPIGLLLTHFGPALFRRAFPINWVLTTLIILGCALAGNLLYSLVSLALGFLDARHFWSEFWTPFLFSTIFALNFGIGAAGYRVLSCKLESAMLELRDRQLKRERESKLAVEAQLVSLESCIRPHFLFNTLNTIVSLIPDDPELAESVAAKFAALLRRSLDSRHERIGPLERELELVGDYLEIERARYGSRLRSRIEVAPELSGTEVPVFSIQTLVENSVKYAVGSRFEGAEICVAIHARDEGVVVEVSDDGPGFAVRPIRRGHGLDNLEQRLVAMYGPSAKLEISRQGGFSIVSFCLPRLVNKTGDVHAASISARR